MTNQNKKHALRPITEAVWAIKRLFPLNAEAHEIYMELGKWFNSNTPELSYFDCWEHELSQDDLSRRNELLETVKDYCNRIEETNRK